MAVDSEQLEPSEEALQLDGVMDEAADEPTGGAITYEISSYGADYTVDGLVRRMREEDFYVPPFQRDYVWSQKQASRFIESLLIGLPIPGIFVYREEETNKHLIVDGQQRLKTLQFFFDGNFKEKKFRLIDVDQRWEAKTIDELLDTDRRALEDSIIHTTVFKQDAPKKDNSSVYYVFERLNTGGINLQPQEIRNCINYGRFTNMLSELNKDENWRKIYGNESRRLKDQELILRFISLFDREKEYKKPMKDFLNKFMYDYKGLPGNSSERFQIVFKNTIELAAESLGDKAFRPQKAINAAVFDSVMVALARVLEARPNEIDPKAIRSSYDDLLKDERYISAYTRATSDEDSVRARIQLATEYLSK